MIRRISTYFQEIDAFLVESILFTEKEFLINPKDKAYKEWINKNPKDFTVIVRRIE